MMKWITSIASLSALASAGLASAGLASTASPMVQLKEPSQKQSVCTIAIASTVKKLDEVPKTISVRFRTYPLGGYSGRPINKTSAYQFVFRGGEDILRSPILMKTLASQVLQNCNEPGTVTFGLDQTDAFAVYGVVKGRVQAFNCYEGDGRRFPKQMPWGQRICL